MFLHLVSPRRGGDCHQRTANLLSYTSSPENVDTPLLPLPPPLPLPPHPPRPPITAITTIPVGVAAYPIGGASSKPLPLSDKYL